MRVLSALLGVAAAIAMGASAMAADRTVTLKVPGMSCPSCPYIVSRTLKHVTGVKSVKTSLETRTAVVVFDDAKTNAGALMSATASAGYRSSIVR
jgi:mercuric ion binding protein